jgi:dienelactone hydrolase
MSSSDNNSGPLHPIRILSPVGIGDTSIWISGVTPRADVTVRQRSNTLGNRGAHASVLEVPISPVTGPVHAIARLGGRSARSPNVLPIRDPGEPGPSTPAKSEVNYGTFSVPVHSTPQGDDGGFNAPLRGELYAPSDNIPHRTAPLVIMAHGHWPFEQADLDSHRGYAWLGEHLASWGFLFCSIDLSTVNRESRYPQSLQQWARAEVVMTMIDCLLDDSTIHPGVDRNRIGLIGHSMGGEGVVLAQTLNRQRRSPYGIKAIVNLAPTNYRTEVSSEGTSYFQIHGSMDRLLVSPSAVTGSEPRFNGFALYDRAWRRRSFAWIEGVTHDGYNTVWWPTSGELGVVGTLEAEEQHVVAQSFITAFFADEILGQTDYRGYLRGPGLPQAAKQIRVQRQHQDSTVEITDDFGDPNPQYLLEPQQPRQKDVNRRGQPVTVDGFGVQFWNLVDHLDIPTSVHVTHGLDIAWHTDDLTLSTGLDRLIAEPDGWLCIRAAIHYDEVDNEPNEEFVTAGADIDLTIELDDGSQRAAVNLSAIRAIEYPLAGWANYSVYQTHRLPIDAFTAVNPELDIRNLQWLRLRPNGVANSSGWILIDDIEFETISYTPASTISMLRAHRVGGGYGPPSDFIDAEIITQLNERPDETFGFQLRNDQTYTASYAMFQHLRSTLANRSQIRLGYQWSGPTVREIVRVIRA